TTESGLKVTATNLDLTISAIVPATVLDEGRTTAPARLLTEYVSSLSDAPCTMELDPATQVLKLSCGVHRANLHGIDAMEFPPLPRQEAASTIDVDSTALQGAITQTVMAASADEASPVLTGTLLQIEGGRLTLAATDRHRLAVKTLDVDGASDAAPV